jgi:EAL domain-containing protein (putative c-di-GMP-specific phosphodiesterase class I)
MLNLAANLGLTTVAEGIETDGQSWLLAALGCQTGQGYLFSRPVPADDIDRLINEHRHRHVPRLALHVAG